MLVSALAGALARYQDEHGGLAVDLPTMIPVNLRPMHLPLPRELGNRFALVLLTLPSSTGARVRAAGRDQAAHGCDQGLPRAGDHVRHDPGHRPPGARLDRFLVTFFAGKATGVTTNVPGPREARYLAGTRISGLLGWVPGSGEQTLGTCIFTYAGTVRIGFKTDATVIPDPERILAAFHAELEACSRPRPARTCRRRPWLSRGDRRRAPRSLA